MTGIIAAMQIEIDLLKASLEGEITTETFSGIEFTQGIIGDEPVVLAVCGIGKVFAAICAQTMILKYAPDLIINTGVAGTLTERLGIGDIAVADRVVQHDMDTTALGDPPGLISGINTVYFPCSEAAVKEFERCIAESGTKSVTGVIASGDLFVHDPAVKERITERFGAVAAEMEGGAIGHVCYVGGTDFIVIRAISDSADGTSCEDYGAFAKASAERSAALTREFLHRKAKK